MLIRLSKWTLITLMFFVFCLFSLLILLFDTEPAINNVFNGEQSSSEKTLRSKVNSDAQQVTALKPLITRIHQQLRLTAGKDATIHINQTEVDDLELLFHRAFPHSAIQANITNQGALISLTTKIRQVPLLPFINISTLVLPSNKGLDLSFIKIGDIEISGKIFIRIMTGLSNFFFKENTLSQIIKIVKKTEFTSNNQMNVVLQPIADIRDRLRSGIVQLNTLSGGEENQIDHTSLSVYIDVLQSIKKQYYRSKQVSLTAFLKPLHEVLLTRSKSMPIKIEYKAAMWALVIQLANHRFQNLIGYTLTNTQRIPFHPNITLSGRRDLFLHFTYSMALQLVSDMHVSFAIGEFKEILDTENGGTGFSFVDLAADMTGTEFARNKGSDEQTIRFIEAIATAENEQVFFPSVLELPEGLTQTQFANEYGSIQSKRYADMVEIIKQKIDALPLYQANK